ncbi:hypothetical protein TNCV_1007671 [Trichonephila clavipes]|nr:hypothetical protein TNCV_1007671 [Trichonephila clavipes]
MQEETTDRRHQLHQPRYTFARDDRCFVYMGGIDRCATAGDDLILTSHCSATLGLLATDHVILNHGQVTWTTPELAPPSPNYHTTPTGGRFSSRQI